MEKRNLQIITLAGAVILGLIESGKDKTVITNSLSLGQVPNVTKKHLAEYIKADNLGTLGKPITVAGPAQFTLRDLEDDLQLEYEILLLKFAQAMKSAPAKAVNAEFSNLIGG
jgi:hypothetical protein